MAQGLFRGLGAALAGAGALIAPALAAEPPKSDEDALKPALADLMTLTQLRHYKLWYAQKVENWELSQYELDRFRSTIERIAKLYPEASSVAQAKLIREKSDPALDEIAKGIAGKNQQIFESGFLKLTDACNQCHKAAGFSFIAIQVPTRSPYANQSFEPAK